MVGQVKANRLAICPAVMCPPRSFRMSRIWRRVGWARASKTRLRIRRSWWGVRLFFFAAFFVLATCSTILSCMRLSPRTKQVKRSLAGKGPAVRGGSGRGGDLGVALGLEFRFPRAHALQGRLPALEEPEGLDHGRGPPALLRHQEALPGLLEHAEPHAPDLGGVFVLVVQEAHLQCTVRTFLFR